MTVQTQFWNWQTNPMQPNPGRCSPLNTTISRWLIVTWGGQNLGCWVNRPVTTGSSPSTHASGAANDWRYQNPGPGRQRMLDEVMPILLGQSLELGVNAVHDYAGSRIWRPPGTSGRPSSPSPECGWRPATSSDMNPANTWIHIEVLNTRWSDTRSIDEMLPPEEDDDLNQDQANELHQTFLNSDWTLQTVRDEVLPQIADLQARMAAQEALWTQDSANEAHATFIMTDWTWQVAQEVNPAQASKVIEPQASPPG